MNSTLSSRWKGQGSSLHHYAVFSIMMTDHFWSVFFHPHMPKEQEGLTILTRYMGIGGRIKSPPFIPMNLSTGQAVINAV